MQVPRDSSPPFPLLYTARPRYCASWLCFNHPAFLKVDNFPQLSGLANINASELVLRSILVVVAGHFDIVAEKITKHVMRSAADVMSTGWTWLGNLRRACPIRRAAKSSGHLLEIRRRVLPSSQTSQPTLTCPASPSPSPSLHRNLPCSNLSHLSTITRVSSVRRCSLLASNRALPA